MNVLGFYFFFYLKEGDKICENNFVIKYKVMYDMKDLDMKDSEW